MARFPTLSCRLVTGLLAIFLFYKRQLQYYNFIICFFVCLFDEYQGKSDERRVFCKIYLRVVD